MKRDRLFSSVMGWLVFLVIMLLLFRFTPKEIKSHEFITSGLSADVSGSSFTNKNVEERQEKAEKFDNFGWLVMGIFALLLAVFLSISLWRSRHTFDAHRDFLIDKWKRESRMKKEEKPS